MRKLFLKRNARNWWVVIPIDTIDTHAYTQDKIIAIKREKKHETARRIRQTAIHLVVCHSMDASEEGRWPEKFLGQGGEPYGNLVCGPMLCTAVRGLHFLIFLLCIVVDSLWVSHEINFLWHYQFTVPFQIIWPTYDFFKISENPKIWGQK